MSPIKLAHNHFVHWPRAAHFRRLTYAALVLAIVMSVSVSSAATPREDFATWYTEWMEALPKWNRVTIKEFFGEPKGQPLEMTITNWGNKAHFLCSSNSSKFKNSYKLLVNSRYAALIVTTLGSPDPIWSLQDFALRSDDHYGSLVDDVDTTQMLIYKHETVFARPYTASEESSPGNTPGITKLVWRFDPESLTADRDLLKVVFTLDDAYGGMPVKITTVERGGIRCRRIFSGWQQTEGVWTYKTETIYVQLAGEEDEQLHSTKSWEHGNLAGAPPTADECFLSFYGLPEPPKSRGMPRIAIFLLAAVLLAIGYAFLRRKGGS